MDPGERLISQVLSARPDLAGAASRILSHPCFRGGGCAPTLISRLLFPYLCGVLWRMAGYWCLCVKHASRCRRGGCPVDPARCAAAYVAARVNPVGDVVRAKFYVYARGELPERFYNAFAKAAARLAAEAGGGRVVPYENLLTAAVRFFLS